MLYGITRGNQLKLNENIFVLNPYVDLIRTLAYKNVGKFLIRFNKNVGKFLIRFNKNVGKFFFYLRCQLWDFFQMDIVNILQLGN